MTTVETATTGHAAAIARVCTASWRDAYADVLPEEYVEANLRTFYRPERIAEKVESERDNPGGWLVARDDGEGETVGDGVVGVVCDERPDPGVGEVSALYVRPDGQGGGVGSTLLDALTERQREAGVTEQRVYVFAGHDDAVGFYESKGFAADERFPAAEVDGVDPDCEAVRLARSV